MPKKPTILDPSSWPHADDAYGRSPCMLVLDQLKAADGLTDEERTAALKHVMQTIAAEQADEG